MFIFLKSKKKKKTVIAFRKKKVNKDTTIVLEFCSVDSDQILLGEGPGFRGGLWDRNEQ